MDKENSHELLFEKRQDKIFWPPPGPSIVDRPESFHLSTNKSYPGVGFKKTGMVQQITSRTFPVLLGTGITTFVYEFFEDSMRVLHWHDKSELGIAQSGIIDVYLFESPEKHSIFRIHPGQAWFIPAGAPHSLNAIGDQKATMIISWNGDTQNAFDFPTIYNGLPEGIRIAYTQPGRHAELSHYIGPRFNPVNGFNPLSSYRNPLLQKHTRSPYKFDVRKSKPLFYNKHLGIIQHGTAAQWPILQDQHISVLFAALRPFAWRDLIWYPDSSILYTVTQGRGQFLILIPGWEPRSFTIRYHDLILVRSNIPHTFQNTEKDQDLHMVGIFNQSNPSEEISLGVSTNFFPRSISHASLVYWGNRSPTQKAENEERQLLKKQQQQKNNKKQQLVKHIKNENPLKYLKHFTTNPYILPGRPSSQP